MKRTLTPWLILLYPLFAVCMVIIINSEPSDKGISALDFTEDVLSVGTFFFPFFLVVLISLLLYFDHQGRAWKFIYSLPVPRSVYYWARLLQLLVLLLVTFVLFQLLTLAGFQLYKLFNPHCEPAGLFEITGKMTRFFGAVYISAFPLIVIQHWVSRISHNVIVPFIVGILAITLPVAVIMILGITGLITRADQLQNLMQYNPYTLCYIPVFESTLHPSDPVAIFPGNIYIWHLSAIVLSIGFYFHISRRNVLS